MVIIVSLILRRHYFLSTINYIKFYKRLKSSFSVAGKHFIYTVFRPYPSNQRPPELDLSFLPIRLFGGAEFTVEYPKTDKYYYHAYYQVGTKTSRNKMAIALLVYNMFEKKCRQILVSFFFNLI